MFYEVDTYKNTKPDNDNKAREVLHKGPRTVATALVETGTLKRVEYNVSYYRLIYLICYLC